jgi:carboxylesterase type B
MKTGIKRFAILLISISGTGIAAAADLRDPVRIETGLVQGVATRDNAVVAFKGIPYAAPPVGNLRWRDPQPPLRWEGVRQADRFGASCLQKVKAGSPKEMSEDCLFLNVWTPARSSAERLPALLFIHGGADRSGSGSGDIYDGEALARKGILVVTINFRLGLLGGFAHPELTAESPHRCSGNYALLDAIAALRWIHGNIAAFGGDPEKVTISGQSSGAHTIHYLTVSPLARGLFRGAIAMSFPQHFMMQENFIGNLQFKEQQGLQFAEIKHARSLEELRRMPAAALLAEDPEVNRRGLHLSGIIQDGWVVPEQYMPAFKKGIAADVPTLIGLTADDFGVIASHSTMTVDAFSAQARQRFGERAAAFLALYPAATDQAAAEMDKQMQREKGMADIFFWAGWRAKMTKTPVYTYLFEQVMPNPEHPELGASHSSDTIYEFNNLEKLDRPWTPDDRRVADNVSSYWVNFVKTGNPNGGNLPQWAPFDPGNAATMVLGVHSGPRPITTPERLGFYRDLLEK